MANPCKCGRSPTGMCNGWHRLSHLEFLRKLREHETKKLNQEAKRRFEKKKDDTGTAT
jgi:hypothetical protein